MIHNFREKRLEQQLLTMITEQQRFEWIGRIGEGAYGVAYLLEQLDTKERVVLKRLKAKRFSKKQRAKFEQEITFLRQLQHLPVPRLLEVGTLHQAPFYTMSFAEGATFEHTIFARNMTYTVAQSLQYAEMLLTIMQKMHAEHIVHRDLRIPNIIINNGELTIIDFGLATTIDPQFSLARMKDPKKAPHPISDLYALGHVMLFLLYSHYTPTSKKSTSWQQELQLAAPLQHYIERLLTIEEPFLSATQALQVLNDVKEAVQK